MPIKNVYARQIFDSRGFPTIEVDLITDLGLFRASVPSAEVVAGTYQAAELRDDDKNNYLGMSVLKAVESVNQTISPELLKSQLEVTQQTEIDEMLVNLDGTDNKSRLGANAILGVSLAVCKAGAAKRGLPLYKHIADLAGNSNNIILPLPAFNVLNGGVYSGNKLVFQEFLLMPTGANTFTEAMKMGMEVYQALKGLLKAKYGANADVVSADGSFSPNVSKPKDALTFIKKAIAKAGYNGRVEIGVDIAATSMYKDGKYDMDFKNPKSPKAKWLTADKLIGQYKQFLKAFPIVSLEDPFEKEQWEQWAKFTGSVDIQVVADDLTVTNSKRIAMALDKKACNCLLLKVGQIGTITEAIKAHVLAKTNGWGTMVSTRLGETEDTFVADLAVGLSTGQVKAGAPCRSDRLAKYNQILRIEEELGPAARFAGRSYRKPQ